MSPPAARTAQLDDITHFGEDFSGGRLQATRPHALVEHFSVHCPTVLVLSPTDGTRTRKTIAIAAFANHLIRNVVETFRVSTTSNRRRLQSARIRRISWWFPPRMDCQQCR